MFTVYRIPLTVRLPLSVNGYSSYKKLMPVVLSLVTANSKLVVERRRRV